MDLSKYNSYVEGVAKKIMIGLVACYSIATIVLVCIKVLVY